MIALRRSFVLAAVCAALFSGFAMTSKAEASPMKGYIYSVELSWKNTVTGQTGVYARYFVTVYDDRSVDYGGADRGWYDILRYQNCQPFVSNYSFWRYTTKEVAGTTGGLRAGTTQTLQ